MSKQVTPVRYSKGEKEAMALVAKCAARRLKVKADYEFRIDVKLYKPGCMPR